MVNQQLLDYVKQQADSGVSEEIIRKNLTGEGWSQSDINEAFSSLNNRVSSSVPKPEVVYAGFWVRFAALFIDSLITNIFFGIVQFLVGLAFNFSSHGKFIFSLINIALYWVYVVYMLNKYQATFGKMALGIKVVSEDGGKLGIGKIILRETLGKAVSTLTLMVGYVMAGFTNKKQALHDKVAGSVVVYKDSNRQSKKWVVAAVIVVCVFFSLAMIGILSSVVLASLNNARNKGNDAAVRSVISTTKIDALLYADKHGGLKGFEPTAQTPVCSGPLAINISDDGKNAVLFGKSCADKNKTFCEEFNVADASTGSVKELDNLQSISGKISCE